ncbi:MAG TPA: GTPase ObgE [Candidatus Paceibacterota bacterium]|nr:GTPase ObgE [Candidatus Paceibacterota bacterium]
MLIDDVTINITAGNGGPGKVAFNRSKMAIGPVGGRGGNGGSIYLEAVSDLGALEHYRFQKDIKAEDGGIGRPQFIDGADGADLILKAPVGTVIHNEADGSESELTHVGERVLVAKGGLGGRGNFFFRSAINTTPRESEPGLPGQSATLRLELKLIADVGFVGLPNVGKSSLLNTLTNAKSKVANYQFTTLEPNLGVYYGLVLADIPGLIEGASEGKGLGVKFLKHIERTRVLFHFLAADAEKPAEDYATIRAELERYNSALSEKQEYVFLSRSDTIEPDMLASKVADLKTKLNKDVIPFSVYDDESLKAVQAILNKINQEKTGA